MDNSVSVQVSPTPVRWTSGGRRVERSGSPVDGQKGVTTGPPRRPLSSTFPAPSSTVVHRGCGRTAVSAVPSTAQGLSTGGVVHRDVHNWWMGRALTPLGQPK